MANSKIKVTGIDKGSSLADIGSFWESTSAKLIVRGNVATLTFRAFMKLSDYAENTMYTLCRIPAGYRPKVDSPLFGRITDGTYTYKGGIAGSVNADGWVRFNCETHIANYFAMTATWMIG